MRIISNKYVVKTPTLCKMLGVSRQTLHTWEKKGYFSPPRSSRGDRVFTITQANEVVRAFGPDGNKQWHFKSKKYYPHLLYNILYTYPLKLYGWRDVCSCSFIKWIASPMGLGSM